MIMVKSFPSWKAAAQHIAQVSANETLQDEYLREPPMTPEGLRKLFWFHDFGPNETLTKIVEDESREVSKGFWLFG